MKARAFLALVLVTVLSGSRPTLARHCSADGETCRGSGNCCGHVCVKALGHQVGTS